MTPTEVKSARQAYQMTQEDFARFMCVSISTVRNWEQGRSKPPGYVDVVFPIISRNVLGTPTTAPPEYTVWTSGVAGLAMPAPRVVHVFKRLGPIHTTYAAFEDAYKHEALALNARYVLVTERKAILIMDCNNP